MLLLLFIIKTLVLTDGKVLKSFNQNRIKPNTGYERKVQILPDDSKPVKRPDLRPETRKIAAEDEDGHKVNILYHQGHSFHLRNAKVCFCFCR